MKFIIIVLGGGGWVALVWALILGGGALLGVKEQKYWKTVQAEAEAALLPPPVFYDAVWHNSRGIAHFQQGNYDRAIRAFRRSYELFPIGKTLNMIAATYYYTGDFDSAIDYWDVAVEIYSEDAVLRQNLKNAQRAREINPSLKPTLAIAENQ
jgi:tetratricopeptide (TPR) repeat protein